MSDVAIRNCGPGDYDAVVRIYNDYIEHSSATFDLTPYSMGERVPWFAQFADEGPYQLLVAELDGEVVGYCYSSTFNPRPAYDISVETTVYVTADAAGQGVGSALYDELFRRIADCGLHGAYAGVTLPNDASVALHEKFGFRRIGVETEVGYKFDQYWDVARYERRL